MDDVTCGRRLEWPQIWTAPIIRREYVNSAFRISISLRPRYGIEEYLFSHFNQFHTVWTVYYSMFACALSFVQPLPTLYQKSINRYHRFALCRRPRRHCSMSALLLLSPLIHSDVKRARKENMWRSVVKHCLCTCCCRKNTEHVKWIIIIICLANDENSLQDRKAKDMKSSTSWWW